MRSSQDSPGFLQKTFGFLAKGLRFISSFFTKHKISRTRKIIGLFLMVGLMAIAFAFAQGSLRTFKIISASMEPAILVGDCILVDARKPVTPRRGDIIALKNPEKPSDWLCKRVAALPNDKIEFRRGNIYVNNKKINTERMRWSSLMRIRSRYHVQQLGPNEYFVLGDNINRSHDSRYFGTVDSEDLIGITTRIYWPPSHARSLKQP